ncbi:PREDICTED: uncharacterized protein LOC105457004, partial [Wasmannia auropunctata]|uniref:uncharacterized protein LOC105457004 n=1 Tax=Wasmannia auropunctata TaxID=64793 RepID=UPI0005EE6B1C
GCKHAIAFLMWVHRRSEEPEPTATVCYWKKPRLAKVSDNVKNIKVKDMVKVKCPTDNKSNYDPDDFYNSLLVEFQSHQFDCQLSRHCIDLKVKHPLSLHEMLITFYTSNNFTPDADSFLTFASSIMTLDLCDKVAIDTNNQSECKLWNELRYSRLTASRLHEMAHCNVSNGSLVNQV